jgi:hypothetical protein
LAASCFKMGRFGHGFPASKPGKSGPFNSTGVKPLPFQQVPLQSYACYFVLKWRIFRKISRPHAPRVTPGTPHRSSRTTFSIKYNSCKAALAFLF